MNGFPGMPPPPGSMPGVAPTLDALRPIEGYVKRGQPNNIGFGKTIDPPTTGIVDPETGLLASPSLNIVDLRPDCVHPELLGVVLGSVALGPFATEDEEKPVHSLVRAEIEWGVGSASYRAECDWLVGTQLSIVAERVKVNARYLRYTKPWEEVPDGIILPKFELSAGVGYGNAGRNSNPARFTEYVQIESFHSHKDIPIPPFATSFTILTYPGSTCSVSQLGYNNVGPLYASSGTLANSGQYDVENSFPIFGGASRLRIANTHESNALYAFIVFGLGI